jgi:hypothetical protein
VIRAADHVTDIGLRPVVNKHVHLWFRDEPAGAKRGLRTHKASLHDHAQDRIDRHLRHTRERDTAHRHREVFVFGMTIAER